MRLIVTILLVFVLTSLHTLQAQQLHRCGITDEDNEWMLKRLEVLKDVLKKNPVSAQKSNEISYLPITFHLVAKSNGTGRVNEKLVLEQLCALNEDFAPAQIQFYLKDGTFNYVNNDVIYDSPFNAEGGVMQFAKDDEAINVWLVNNANQEDGTPGQVRGYYRAFFDWIVLDKSFVNKNNIGLTHELGHFFSIPHPFLGWDSDPYDPNKHGNPAPVRSPSGRLTELMDGSNCETAGDGICDTPPDYNFGFGANNCNYNGGAMDPKGVLVNPDEANFVGYFLNCERTEYSFTAQQLDIIRANLVSDEVFSIQTPSRDYLRNSSGPPTTTEITELPQLLLPQNESIVSNAGTIYLEWTAPAGATHYLLEISPVPTFSIQTQRFTVEGNSFELDGSLVTLGRKYYWRVLPYNALSTCMPPTANKAFTIGETTAVQEIPEIESFNILPNPAPSNQQFQLLAEVSERFEAQGALFNTTGQMIKALGQYNFVAGSNTFSIPTDNLAPGIYMLSLQSEKGRSIRRIIVY
jgi:hypothetical protein